MKRIIFLLLILTGCNTDKFESICIASLGNNTRLESVCKERFDLDAKYRLQKRIARHTGHSDTLTNRYLKMRDSLDVLIEDEVIRLLEL